MKKLECPKCRSDKISENIYYNSSKKAIFKVIPITFLVLYIFFYIFFDESIILILIMNYLILMIPFLLIMYKKKGINRCNKCNYFFSAN